MMSSQPQKITLASVPYLNAKPLMFGLADSGANIIEAVPAQLLEIFDSREVDAALISAYDVLQMPDADIVDNIAIGCCGEVYSVLLAYEGELKNIKQVTLDPSSHTGNNLLKIILTEFYELRPEFLMDENLSDVLESVCKVAETDEEQGVDGAQELSGLTSVMLRAPARRSSSQSSVDCENRLSLPRLIIGDPAIAFRKEARCSVLDLGAEWYRFTGLPFVFALWCLKNSANKKEVSERLQLAKEQGLRAREEIAATQPDPKFALRYLTEHIRYDLGKKELAGLELFKFLLQKYYLMP